MPHDAAGSKVGLGGMAGWVRQTLTERSLRLLVAAAVVVALLGAVVMALSLSGGGGDPVAGDAGEGDNYEF